MRDPAERAFDLRHHEERVAIVSAAGPEIGPSIVLELVRASVHGIATAAEFVAYFTSADRSPS
jgi:hypothetical protein